MIDENRKSVISFYPSIGGWELREYQRLVTEYNSLPDGEKNPKEKPRPKFRRTSTKTMSLVDVYDYIRTPHTLTGYHVYNGRTYYGKDGNLLSVTNFVRESPGEYKLRKTFLFDNVVFGGVPKGEDGVTRRKKSNFNNERKDEGGNSYKVEGIIYSELVVIDLDHLKEQGIKLDELRSLISQDTEIGLRLLFVSPSGDGLKLICKSKRGFNSPEEYKREYDSLVLCISEKLKRIYPSFVVDTSGSDISRTCFLCYDPEALLLDSSFEFDSAKYPVPEKEKPVRRTYANSYSDDDGIEDLVRKVEELRLAIVPTYKEYFPLVCSFSALGERGRDYLHRVCSLSPKYDPEDTDFDFDNNIPGTPQSIGFFVNLCKRNGIDVTRPKNNYNRQNKTMKEKDENISVETEKVAQNGENYANRYILPKEGDLWKDLSREPEGFSTSYVLGQDNQETLVIPREGVTMICGLSSHGKSTLLRNLALQYVEDEKSEGDVLFFTLEESERKTKLRLLNTYIGERLSKGKNLDRIREYARTKSPEYMTEDKRDIFLRKSKEFESFLTTGKLRIYSDFVSSLELVEFLRDFATKRKIKSVFVDYIQRLDSGRKTTEKTEKLEKVVEDLQDFTKETQIPVLAAAQLNRLASSPSNMGSNNIAGSADLTRYAETIICLWNSTKREDITDKTFFDSEDGKRLAKMRFNPGTSGQVYIKVTKNREGESGIDGVFSFDGNTERISDNDLPIANTAQPETNKTIWGK